MERAIAQPADDLAADALFPLNAAPTTRTMIDRTNPAVAMIS
jgi:hypothetical protein